MPTCIFCRWETVLDAVVLTSPAGNCICLRCYARETDSAKPLSRELRREVVTLLALLDPA